MKKSALFLGLIESALVVGAAEWRPVAVPSAGETHNASFAPEKMIDGDLNTYACFLDDTRTGRDANAQPPCAAEPVTCGFTLDLGAIRPVRGLRFVARNAWMSTMAANVTVWSCSDAAGMRDLVPLAADVDLPPVVNCGSAFVTWRMATTRYLKVRVNDANRKPARWPWAQVVHEWCRQNGDPLGDEGPFFNCQIAEVTAFDAEPDDIRRANRPDEAFPRERLVRDWVYQDFGLRGWPKYVAMTPSEKSAYEAKCAARRRERLAKMRAVSPRFVYAKHHVFGGEQGLVSAYDQWDDQVKTELGNHTGIARSHAESTDGVPMTKAGSQLCLGTILEDGSISHEVLLDRPKGCIAHPSISWDGTTLAFAMRDDFDHDCMSLYVMDLASRRVTRITRPEKGADGRDLAVTDTEPAWLPDGDLVFTSTRMSRICDCWYRAGGDIYRCHPDGTGIRRLTADELVSDLPQVTEDGKVVFTRWEYNDRSALYEHPLIWMNPDGTGQTEYYGNNSMFPSSIIYAHGVPGSTKLLALIAGHHAPYKGKLALIDRSEGTQGGEGFEFVAGAAPDRTPGRKKMLVKPRGLNDFKVDIFGQDGPQWAGCFAFDEMDYLVSYQPEGCCRMYGPYEPPFGAYWQNADGARELLAFDWDQCAGAPVPVMPRKKPPVQVDRRDTSSNWGSCYVQDVYLGPGLAGIPRGTVKKLRVVGLEYRTARVGWCGNGGECETGLNQTPISLNSGAWDVKHVLGEVDVEEDGSCAFEVPANQAVYFQLLDAKGHCVQSMRSWATLMPGEKFGCLGCHEPKRDSLAGAAPTITQSVKKPPQKLRPFACGTKEHPLVARYRTEKWDGCVANYLGLNAPRSTDSEAPVEGFSYRREIQPILDRSCVKCHDAKHKTLNLTGERFPDDKVWRISPTYYNPKRAWTQSYVNLTAHGNPDKNKWLKWLKPRSRAMMLPPYHLGACKSPIFTLFDGAHHGVKLTENEKRVFACWIDLLCPFSGSFAEANTWTEEEKKTFLHFQNKRVTYAEHELRELKKDRTAGSEE